MLGFPLTRRVFASLPSRLRPSKSLCDGVSYLGMWASFRPRDYSLHHFFAKRAKREGRVIYVLGPFVRREWRILMAAWLLLLRHALRRDWRYDFYVTHENKPTYDGLAVNHIGFWLFDDRKNVLRFPYWKVALTESSRSSAGATVRPDATALTTSSLNRFGKQLATRKLRAAIVTSHLRPPRRRLIELVSSVMECDVYGRASGRIIQSKSE